MKKLAVFLVILSISGCKKAERSGISSSVPVKNEMVALMDEMMTEMHGKSTGNNDADFAKMMIAHHKGAVKMAELQIKEGTDKELHSLSNNIIAAQNDEINLMQKFTGSSDKSPDTQAFSQDLNASMTAMMKKVPIHNNVDKDFTEQMIPHHQSAVDMANVYLKYGKNPQLIELCNSIVNAQTSEIALMKKWLQQHP